MNKWDLYKSFDGIDEEILERSEKTIKDWTIMYGNGKQLKKRTGGDGLKWLAAAAACLCLIAAVAICMQQDNSGEGLGQEMLQNSEGDEESETGDVLPTDGTVLENPTDGTGLENPAEGDRQDGDMENREDDGQGRDSKSDDNYGNDTEGQDELDYRWAIVYNEPSSVLAMDWSRYSGEKGIFHEELSPEEIDAITPGAKREWMKFSGYGIFNGYGKLLEIKLFVTTTVPGREVCVTIGNGAPGNCYVVESPESSVIGGAEFMVYRFESEHGSLSDRAITVSYEALCERDGIGYTFLMNVDSGASENAEVDFAEILACFSECEYTELSAVTAELIPEWREDTLTLQEAMEDEAFGRYLLTEVPVGYTAERFYRYKGMNGDYLSASWTSGYDRISWSISRLNDEIRERIVHAEEIDKYDLSLYPIPRAESVPDELREIVDRPVFLIEELDLDMISRRVDEFVDAGDSSGPRMDFSVVYQDVVISIKTKGVSPEWLLDQLKKIAADNVAD